MFQETFGNFFQACCHTCSRTHVQDDSVWLTCCAGRRDRPGLHTGLIRWGSVGLSLQGRWPVGAAVPTNVQYTETRHHQASSARGSVCAFCPGASEGLSLMWVQAQLRGRLLSFLGHRVEACSGLEGGPAGALWGGPGAQGWHCAHSQAVRPEEP